MYKTVVSTLILHFIFIAGTCIAQINSDSLSLQKQSDTILLTDGTIIIPYFIDTTGGIVKYSTQKRPGKIRKIDADELFSIRNKQSETILYIRDTLGENYSEMDMRYLILGQQDARKATKTYVAPFVTNLLLSAGAGLTKNFLSPLIPLAFTAILTIPKIKIRKENVSNPEYLNDEAYVTGYKQEAFKKKRVQTLLGGGIGLAAGLITSFILQSQGIDIVK
jgi:hypothetical protein